MGGRVPPGPSEWAAPPLWGHVGARVASVVLCGQAEGTERTRGLPERPSEEPHPAWTWTGWTAGQAGPASGRDEALGLGRASPHLLKFYQEIPAIHTPLQAPCLLLAFLPFPSHLQLLPSLKSRTPQSFRKVGITFFQAPVYVDIFTSSHES